MMKRTAFKILTLLFVSLWCVPLWAHHPGGGGGSLSLGRSVVDMLNPPRTNVTYQLEVNSLDNGVGYSILNRVQGEYAFLKRFSIGAAIPVWTVSNSFISDNTKLGDVALLFKALAFSSTSKRINLTLGLNTTFPTGSDQVSLGAGAVTFQPYATFLKDWSRVDFFLNLGSTLEADAEVNPTFEYELGLSVEMIRGRVPLSFFLSYQGITFIQGDTFQEGSTKGYIVPGFLVQVDERLEMAFLGRVSVVDSLSFKSNVTFNDFATGLFTDIAGSFMMTVGYKF